MVESRLDWIRIRDWRLDAIVGVYASERTAPRPLWIDLALGIKAGPRPDDLAQTVDYDALHQAIRRRVADSSFTLIESVAELIARTALETDRVDRVTVCVGKPGALPGARTVEIEITRGRGDYDE